MGFQNSVALWHRRSGITRTAKVSRAINQFRTSFPARITSSPYTPGRCLRRHRRRRRWCRTQQSPAFDPISRRCSSSPLPPPPRDKPTLDPEKPRAAVAVNCIFRKPDRASGFVTFDFSREGWLREGCFSETADLGFFKVDYCAWLADLVCRTDE